MILTFLAVFTMVIAGIIWQSTPTERATPVAHPVPPAPEKMQVEGEVESAASTFDFTEERGGHIVTRLRAGRMLGMEGGSRVLSEIIIEYHPETETHPQRMARVGGDAVRPAGARDGATLLLFAQMEHYEQFFVRLGAAWNVTIAPPKAGGLALEDFAGSYWDPVKGVDRPVFLHETIHAIVAQRWRIAPRQRGGDWVQEGTANYLQLCLHPDSMPRTVA